MIAMSQDRDSRFQQWTYPIRRHIGDRQSLGVFAALRGVHRGIQEHDEQKHLEGGLPFLCYSP